MTQIQGTSAGPEVMNYPVLAKQNELIIKIAGSILKALADLGKATSHASPVQVYFLENKNMPSEKDYTIRALDSKVKNVDLLKDWGINGVCFVAVMNAVQHDFGVKFESAWGTRVTIEQIYNELVLLKPSLIGE